MTRTQQFIALMMVASRIAAASNIQEDRYASVINQSPRHYIIFKVCKSKAIHKKVKVVVYTEYVTNRIEPQCVIVTARFEGASVPRQRSIYHTIALKPNEHCRSEKIALDEVVPGFCRWSIGPFGYALSIDGKKLKYEGDEKLALLKRCRLKTKTSLFVNLDNQEVSAVYMPRYRYINRNCKQQLYQLNIGIKSHAKDS